MSKAEEIIRKIYNEGEAGIDFNSLFPNNKIVIMQVLSRKFGINITVLSKEGQGYTYVSRDKKTDDQRALTRLVPKGKSYVRILSLRNNLRGFWKAVDNVKVKTVK